MLESEVVARLRSAGCVFAEDEARLIVGETSSAEALTDLVRRRVEGEPLEQLLGWAEFCGLRIAVEPGVFVPRRRTEFLVELAAALRPNVVLDLCCGSGAIGAAVLAVLGSAEVHATDVDPAAVRCARRNVAGQVYEGNLYDPLPADLVGRVDVLTANAPYVPTDAIHLMPREARLYEALVALDGGADGVGIQRQVIAGADRWLAPGGRLLIETSPDQAAAGIRACVDHGLLADVARSHDHDATVLIARRR